jgi:hypothetical protein
MRHPECDQGAGPSPGGVRAALVCRRQLFDELLRWTREGVRPVELYAGSGAEQVDNSGGSGDESIVRALQSGRRPS